MTKKFGLLAGVIALMTLASCEKCADCSCSGDVDFDFDPNITSATQTTVENAYINGFDGTYPADEQEICEKRGDFDAAIATYESASTTFSETQTAEGYNYSLNAIYTCTCTEN